MDNICIFEDYYYENFLPLTYSRPVFELRCGFNTLREKIEFFFPEVPLYLLMRDYLKPLFLKKSSFDKNIKGSVLYINGRIIMKEKPNLREEGIYYFNNEIVFIYLKERTFNSINILEFKEIEKFKEIGLKEFNISNITIIKYPWDIIKENGNEIKREFSINCLDEQNSSIDVDIIGDKKLVYIGKDVEAEKHIVFDVRKGPVYVGDNTDIRAFSRIAGPTYIGKKCLIKSGRIQECSIGNTCKVGGEIEESIFHGYSNKQHYGFIGHSYIGEWVNLGAGTSNSDLKDTYGNIKYKIAGKSIDSGQQFFGCVIGDNAKSSIGTLIYTGKKIGFAAHIHGIISEDVPSFCMWAKSLGSKTSELFFDSAITTYSRAAERRGVILTKEYEELMKKIFDFTKDERKTCDVYSNKFSIG
ncbi:MAG: Bifunctional protein GlmU [Candidatus Methanofastidiosum methylothiophilum]|uniref:Bifunctional protein GlmU n=1 Tax=Candidatus Methanofastidiosum methylothiophilum TaxID=1705564 RepID=A0A150IU80_9EURY|nr:MAG: Bifunctional protein GlmU [Candidatus Methanofastidiosum methylthiophilus]KYC48510.1 MAG: Bifunctional protein GlmU [Candidatus Methanofastidiosum methylthiophilus]KYC49663.1 MAG: Bifunctional protein GlmU [Candidatus Methanofastidiosum methylthiophilus]